MTYLEQFQFGRLQPISYPQLMDCKDLRDLHKGLDDAFLYGRLYKEIQNGNLTLSVFFLYFVKFNLAIEILTLKTSLMVFVYPQDLEIVVVVKDGATYEDRQFKYFDFKLFDNMSYLEIAEYIIATLTMETK